MKLLMTLVLAVALQSSAADNKPNKKPNHKADEQTMTIPLDAAASSINWTGKKLKGQHNGTVMFKEGHFVLNKDGVTGGEVVVDLSTIKDADLTDAEYNKKLVGHLQSEDFFDVAKFPTATFKIKKFKESHTFAPGTPNAEASGDLTIRGVTKPAKMKLFYYSKDNGFEAKGKMEIDRTQYGLKYNSKKFFSIAKLGDKLIDDKFELEFSIVAKK